MKITVKFEHKELEEAIMEIVKQKFPEGTKISRVAFNFTSGDMNRGPDRYDATVTVDLP
jgi:hypothetical protein